MRCDKRNSVVQLRIQKLGKLQGISFRIGIFKYSLHFSVTLTKTKCPSKAELKHLFQVSLTSSETNPLENDLHPQGLSKNFDCTVCKVSVVTKSL